MDSLYAGKLHQAAFVVPWRYNYDRKEVDLIMEREWHKGVNKRNYQKEMEKEIRINAEMGKIPTLFLHSCCAPCSSYVLEYLSSYFQITVYYYNPNIYPPEEYRERSLEVERLIGELKTVYPIKFISGDYNPQLFYHEVEGFEEEPEGGERCEICFKLRLQEAARIAAEQGYDYYTTTLTISPLKDAECLNTLGESIGLEYGIAFLNSDFKKKNGYKRSIELSSEHHLYRQDYCGCVFSKRDRDKRIEAGCQI